MGFFGLSKSEDSSSQIPMRSKREKCWESRDLFNKCLDKYNIDNALDKNSIKIINQNCAEEDKQFNKDCAASWVEYFKGKRYVEIKKAKMLEQVEIDNAKLRNDNNEK
ncbi:hypothetical protein PACTADRAFT_39201 [Pachysolen tannophilus NRRL Y-2460]|uniref:Cytochrome c oxidase assembly factor 6 n=1 Tax=Pachysolen tannophilus NRRL Y-2460 TaxID=669874 RepID=A0A1E4TYX2_PACTA|nr:hypothetical protein PACTADRAFT_39201 [Pachysolen tannophilus NRRL Y-2460]